MTGVQTCALPICITFNGSLDGDEPRQFELVINDRIEHGPFPLSRLKALKLMPVMATSNYALESNPALEKWFAAANGKSPVEGQASLGYDRSVQGTVRLNPVQAALDVDSNLQFSGLTVDFDTLSDDAVTIRERDTMTQERIAISQVKQYLAEKLPGC